MVRAALSAWFISVRLTWMWLPEAGEGLGSQCLVRPRKKTHTWPETCLLPVFWIKRAWTSLQTVILVCCKASAGICTLKAELCWRPEGDKSSQGRVWMRRGGLLGCSPVPGAPWAPWGRGLGVHMDTEHQACCWLGVLRPQQPEYLALVMLLAVTGVFAFAYQPGKKGKRLKLKLKPCCCFVDQDVSIHRTQA